MLKIAGLMLVPLGALLSGCVETGTSFGVPDAVMTAPVYPNAAAAVTDLNARNIAYRKAANGAANGSQIFDVPTILAGTAAVAAGAFKHAGKDMAPIAGTIAASGLGFRTYYNTGSRYGAYVAGARAMSCLHKDATALSAAGLDADTLAKWQALVNIAPDNQSSSMYKEVITIGPEVTGALSRLSSGVLRADTEVIRKIQTPTAPDLSTYWQNYQTAVSHQTAASPIKALAFKSADYLQARYNLRSLKLLSGDGEDLSGFDAQATLLFSNKGLVDAASAVEADVEQCVGFAS